MVRNEHVATDTNWTNICAAKRLVYGYCIIADQLTDKTNILRTAEASGNDFFLVVRPPTDGWHKYNLASVFMHELGHSLGLVHNGRDSLQLYVNKTNY